MIILATIFFAFWITLIALEMYRGKEEKDYNKTKDK